MLSRISAIENSGDVGQVILEPGMQWTGARDVREQVLHLVGEYPPPLEVDVLGIVRRKRNGNELHGSLLRRPAAFVVIAAPAGGRDVVPDIEPALRQRRNVVARQITRWKLLRAIQAKIRVSLEQRAVIEWRNIFVANEGETLASSLRRNYRMDFDLAAATVKGVVAAENGVQRRAAGVGNLRTMVEPNSLPIVDPLEGHSSHVGS